MDVRSLMDNFGLYSIPLRDSTRFDKTTIKYGLHRTRPQAASLSLQLLGSLILPHYLPSFTIAFITGHRLFSAYFYLHA